MKENSIDEFEDFNEGNLAKELGEQNQIIIGKAIVKNYEIGDFIVKAVDNVSINITFSEFITIKGPSGAGKTTLLNLLGGLDSPDSGIIYN